ncbi:MAG: FHA domain-containing protein [Myxococcota bacterium]
MNETDLERELATLGLDRHSAPLLALLPLVEVAWADGSIQDSERTVILAAAERFGLDDGLRTVLDGWLASRPDPDLVGRGRLVLTKLCVDQALACDDVVTLSREVAKAAGGWFGFGAIEADEARLIDEIAATLNIDAERPWALPQDPTHVPEDADAESDGPLVAVTFHGDFDGRAAATLVFYDPFRGDQVAGIGEVPLTIGRADDNAVQIEYDAQVSRHHAEIRRTRTAVVLRDLGSVSGTWVDGKRVTEHALVDGEAVGGGSTTFFFQQT